MKTLIGLDLGTSAVKGIAVTADGVVLSQVSRETRLRHLDGGHVEFEAQAHRRQVLSVIRQLTNSLSANSRVVGISMAAASGNTLLCDTSGTPLTPVISWLDQRTQRGDLPTLRALDAETIHQHTGWPFRNWFSLAHLAWFQEHQPDLYARASHACMNTDWLGFCMTGQWGSDYSTATPSFLVDQEQRCYWDAPLDLLELDGPALSPLYPTGTVLGPVTRDVQQATGLTPDTLFVLGAFDHPCAARGMGILAPGQILLSCGTSWVGFTPIQNREQALKANLLVDPFLQPTGPWGGMFSLPRVGEAIDTFVNSRFQGKNRYQQFEECAKQEHHDDAGACRALMEIITSSLQAQLIALPLPSVRTSELAIVGGVAGNPTWLQLIANLTGCTVNAGTPYAGALGAAIIAGIGAGLFRDERDGYAALGQQGTYYHAV